MIFKDGEITVIEFGTGDIDIRAGFIDDPAVTAEIGSRHSSAGDYGCDDISGYVNEHTRFVFYNTQSIDVVIELLLKAKKHMLE